MRGLAIVVAMSCAACASSEAGAAPDAGVAADLGPCDFRVVPVTDAGSSCRRIGRCELGCGGGNAYQCREHLAPYHAPVGPTGAGACYAVINDAGVFTCCSD